MSKLVVFNIGEGNFEQGFPVTLQIGEEGKLAYKDHQDRLSPAPKLPDLYRQWQQKYYGLEPMRRVIKVPPVQISNVSTGDCKEAAEALKACVKEWFDQRSLLNLRSHVLDEVGPDESVRIIFQTQDELLRKLPWHLWDLFERRPKAEFSISARYAPHTPELKRPVKILAILGGDEGIDTKQDLDILEKLPGAKVTPLKKPKQDKLNDELWNQPWDILFFSGHSSSHEGGKSGVIQLNDTDSLSLTQLRYALKKAIGNGLKLAIFNSCDGLGLANDLADLHIPQAIIMREPVPDRVAQKFLQYFLEYFSTGEAFYLAVRQAREKLQGMEGEFPCASWLPVISQNPAETPPIWPRSPITRLRTKIRLLWRSHKVAVLAGGAIAAAIIVVISSRIPHSQESTLGAGNRIIPSPGQGIADHFSGGEKLLIKNNTLPAQLAEKLAGIEAFSAGNFLTAIKHFEASLKKNPNDPESLIYLNNAVAEQKAKIGSGEKLEIAVSVPISAEPEVAKQILRGVAHAQTEFNCKIEETLRAIADAQSELNCNNGVGRKLLQVTIADDKDKPEIAEQVAGVLVKEQDILGVIGHYSSDATLQAAGVYEKGRLVVISPTSTSVRLSNLSPYLFRTPSDDKIAAQDLVSQLNKFGAKKVSLVYDPGNNYSQSLTDEFREQLPSGTQVVHECNDLANKGFNAWNCVKQAKDKGVEAMLLVPGTEKTLDQALRVVNSNNGDLKLLGGDSMYHGRTIQEFGEEAAKGQLTIAAPWHADVEFEDNNDSVFLRNSIALWKTRYVNWRTAMTYDATQAIIEGLTKASCDRGTSCRDLLKQALLSVSADGATGKVEFEQSGDRKSFTNIGVLVQVQPNPAPNSDFDYRFALLE
jgi:branched-chain amino acid transport system substrate-binding protein